MSHRIYRTRTRTWYRGRPVSALGVRGTRSAIVVAGYRTSFEVALGVVNARRGDDLEDAVKKRVDERERATGRVARLAARPPPSGSGDRDRRNRWL